MTPSSSEIEAEETVLVVDDNKAMRHAIGRLLCSVGLNAKLFASVPEFLRAGLPDTASCLVLDVRLRGQSGMELQRHLVEANNPLPIIFITGHADVPMCAQAMKRGAVEFLIKPFREQELLDAVATALARDRVRRANEGRRFVPGPGPASLTPPEAEVEGRTACGRPRKISIGNLSLATNNRELTGPGLAVRLGDRAFSILCVLAERPGEVVPKRELLARVWPDTFVCENALRAHITGLRRTFEGVQGPRVQIVNAVGRGYMLTVPDTDSKQSEASQLHAIAGRSVS